MVLAFFFSFLFLTLGSQHYSCSASHVRLLILDSRAYSREASQRISSSCCFCHFFCGDILILLPRRGEEFHGARIRRPHHQQRKLTFTQAGDKYCCIPTTAVTVVVAVAVDVDPFILYILIHVSAVSQPHGPPWPGGSRGRKEGIVSR